MAYVKIEEIIERLKYGMKRALEDAVSRTLPGVSVDCSELLKEFVKAVGKTCSMWEQVPDKYVKPD
jgi:hypothetical protein